MEKQQQQDSKFKILMFPWLAHGHIFPFVELAKRLPTTNFTIYLLQMEMPSSLELPPELHTTKNLPFNLISKLIQAFKMSKPSFSDILESVQPDLLIYDCFQPWAPKLASSKGIPSVYFSVAGTVSFSYYHHVHTMGKGSTFPYKAICIPDEEISKVLNRLSREEEELSVCLRNLENSHINPPCMHYHFTTPNFILQ